MSRRVLVVQWLNGALKAASISGKEVNAEWVHSAPVETLEEMCALLPKLIADSGYKGRDAVMVVENRKLIYHLQESPPGRRATIRKFLERTVDHAKFFDGEPAAWGSGLPIFAKTGHRYLLTLLPRSWVLNLRENFSENSLRLVGVFAPAAVLSRCLTQLPIDAEKPVLVAAEVGGMLSLAAGKKTGHVWFARSVNLTAPQGAPEAAGTAPALRVVRVTAKSTDRLEQELNRTRLFCRQQLEVQISSLWVVGEGARQAATQSKLPEGLKLEDASIDTHPQWFALLASTLTQASHGNLLDQVEGEDVRQRRLAAMSTAAALLVVCGLWMWVNQAVENRRKEMESLFAQASELRTHYEEDLKRWQLALEQGRMLTAVGSHEDPDPAALFSRYLSQTFPDHLMLTQFEFQQSSNGWSIRLEGRAKGDGADHLNTVHALEEQLAQSPFKVVTIASTRTQFLAESPEVVRKVVAGSSESQQDKPFFIEGRIP